MSPTRLLPPNLRDVLQPLIPDRLALLQQIFVAKIDAPGRIAYLTAEAISALKSGEEF